MRAAVLGVVLLTAACGGPEAVPPPSGPPVSDLRIGLSEYRLALSAGTVRTGPLEIVVTNVGAVRHDVQLVQNGFVLGASAVLPPGGRDTVRVQVPGAGRIELRCTVGGHAEAGMTGSLGVG